MHPKDKLLAEDRIQLIKDLIDQYLWDLGAELNESDCEQAEKWLKRFWKWLEK